MGTEETADMRAEYQEREARITAEVVIRGQFSLSERPPVLDRSSTSNLVQIFICITLGSFFVPLSLKFS